MSDIYVTLSGNVTKDPQQFQFADGSRVTTMRVAVNRRVLDQQSNTWQTRDTAFYMVRCFRGLGDNVHQSIRKGQPVVVHGRLRIKQYERNGEQRLWVEIEASSVGHDLKYGIAAFERPLRSYSNGAPSDEELQAMEDATREWELPASGASRARGGGLSEVRESERPGEAAVGEEAGAGAVGEEAGAGEAAEVTTATDVAVDPDDDALVWPAQPMAA